MMQWEICVIDPPSFEGFEGLCDANIILELQYYLYTI